jgi:hypothetical protein
MCRNIKTLYNFDPPATNEEIHASALQYVRKISGFQNPSQVNTAIFERAVLDISRITGNLLDKLVTNAEPRNRDVETSKARERNVHRFR